MASRHAHLLTAPDEDRDPPEQQDGGEDADRQSKNLRRRPDAFHPEAADLGAIDAVAEGCAEAGPGEGDEKSHPERSVGGTALQRVEQVADGADIVVCRAARARSLMPGRPVMTSGRISIGRPPSRTTATCSRSRPRLMKWRAQIRIAV